MAWDEATAENWYWFLEFATRSNYAPPILNACLFRGQSNAEWGLVPTLLRRFRPISGGDRDDAEAAERYATHQFRARAALDPGSEPILVASPDPIYWWSLMQHYRAPTRLLDWSFSPFVAAYFAVNEHLDKDGALWFFHVGAFLDATTNGLKYQDGMPGPGLPIEYYYNRDQPERLAYVLGAATIRSVAQQATHTVSNNVLLDHGDYIGRNLSNTPTGDCLRKVIIPKHLKDDFRRHLHNMNICAHSLFPGLDGLGKSLCEAIDTFMSYKRKNFPLNH